MAYSDRIKQVVAAAPDGTLSKKLADICIKTEIPVHIIAQWMGVSRQGVYYWFSGETEIREAKRQKVEKIIQVLEKAYNENALPVSDLETALTIVGRYKNPVLY